MAGATGRRKVKAVGAREDNEHKPPATNDDRHAFLPVHCDDRSRHHPAPDMLACNLDEVSTRSRCCLAKADACRSADARFELHLRVSGPGVY